MHLLDFDTHFVVPVVGTDGLVEKSPWAGKVVAARRLVASADTAEEVGCKGFGTQVGQKVTADWVRDSRCFEQSLGSLEVGMQMLAAADMFEVR